MSDAEPGVVGNWAIIRRKVTTNQRFHLSLFVLLLSRFVRPVPSVVRCILNFIPLLHTTHLQVIDKGNLSVKTAPAGFPKDYGIKPLRFLFRFLLEIPTNLQGKCLWVEDADILLPLTLTLLLYIKQLTAS